LEKNKVDVVAQTVGYINPHAVVNTLTDNIKLEEKREKFISLINNHDFIIGATDDMRVQSNINRIAYRLNKTSVYIGVYDEGKGGEVVICHSQSPCYSCITNRFPVDSKPGENYNTGRTKSVNAIGLDIMSVVTSAARIILGLLCLKEEINGRLKLFAQSLISNKLNFLQVSHYPDQWFTNMENIGLTVLPTGQYAMSHYWHNPLNFPHMDKNRDLCTICGKNPQRIQDDSFVTLNQKDILNSFKTQINNNGDSNNMEVDDLRKMKINEESMYISQNAIKLIKESLCKKRIGGGFLFGSVKGEVINIEYFEFDSYGESSWNPSNNASEKISKVLKNNPNFHFIGVGKSSPIFLIEQNALVLKKYLNSNISLDKVVLINVMPIEDEQTDNLDFKIDDNFKVASYVQTRNDGKRIKICEF